ncbi:MAG: VWA domain-containing protein [Ruminococcus sp.]|nr:VWA domain-containing protein [Ruminococcus sp.]
MNSGFLGETAAIARRVMTIFLLVDASGSMQGEKMGAVNSAVEEMIPDLRKLSESNADAEIKLAVLKFADDCEWVSPKPVSLENFGDWEEMTAGGLTALGAACKELSLKLSQKTGYMTKADAPIGYYAPVVILLSDGGPTDDFKDGIAKLKENKWFKAALKIAVAIGKKADMSVLEEFTDNVELVIPVSNSSTLKKVIRFAAVTSSQIASTSSSVASEEGTVLTANVSDVSSANAQHQVAEELRIFRESEEKAADISGDDVYDEDF